ncbi:hypothetical protein ACFVFS_39210 [Kitasatospora sp. NPDC057692]|uniref:hypothetical protein n=1 Tax=Kitasatospora sp. NPDC057692 TaxID=3346215 RepID=UPI0036982395
MSVLSQLYSWAEDEQYTSAMPFTYRQALTAYGDQVREQAVNLARRRMPKPHVTIKYFRNDLVCRLQVREVLVVRDRAQGTSLAVNHQSCPGGRLPALYAHHATDLGLGAVEDRDPASLIEIAKGHPPIISNGKQRPSGACLVLQVRGLCR